MNLLSLPPVLAGLLLGFGLIVAIGAQNVFVIRQGLRGAQVLPTALTAAICDSVLIFLGIGGLFLVIEQFPIIAFIAKWLAVAFLTWYGLVSLRRVFQKPEDSWLNSGSDAPTTVLRAVTTTLGFSLLNPHVYFDTVVKLGSTGAQFGDQRWWFALGAMTASFVWFFSISYGAKQMAPALSTVQGARILDSIVASIMFIFAGLMALSPAEASAQAVVNTVKLGPCEELTGVCLANPTKRYQHGVFGESFEYGTLMTIDASGSALQTYNLPYETVFEDRRVRVTDLDDDGRKEVIVIVTHRNQGAALALYAFDAGSEGTSASVFPMAQSAFIGTGQRWLNPLDGAVDLDGDGSREIAVIETPHIRPTLRIHQWNGGKLDELARFRLTDHSNHQMGSMDLAGAIFCDTGTIGQAAVQIPSSRGGASVFLLDMQAQTLSPTNFEPAERINPNFFDQNVACARLRDQF
jgi:L-lysine exporter family protein LysE/ArgO